MRYGLIHVKEKDKTIRREIMIEKIKDLINQIIPDEVCIEDVHATRINIGNDLKLAKLYGVVEGLCKSNHIRFMSMTPAEWRKKLRFVQGRSVSREALKLQAQTLVKNRYGIEVTEDEADAICIGLSFFT